MTQPELEEMGPIDYIVLEWPGRQPTGEAAPLIIDLVERGIIRILDIAFMRKLEDGSIDTLDLGALNGDSAGFDEFEGASSGLLSQEDLEEAASGARAGHDRRDPRVGEPLGGSRRGRAAPVRRAARRQRANRDPGHPRRARRARSHQLNPKETPCPD